MSTDLLSKLEALMDDTGLSAHRVGILCAKNGRLVERLQNGGRVWPETEQEIVEAIDRVRGRAASRPPKGAA